MHIRREDLFGSHKALLQLVDELKITTVLVDKETKTVTIFSDNDTLPFIEVTHNG